MAGKQQRKPKMFEYKGGVRIEEWKCCEQNFASNGMIEHLKTQHALTAPLWTTMRLVERSADKDCEWAHFEHTIGNLVFHQYTFRLDWS